MCDNTVKPSIAITIARDLFFFFSLCQSQLASNPNSTLLTQPPTTTTTTTTINTLTSWTEAYSNADLRVVREAFVPYRFHNKTGIDLDLLLDANNAVSIASNESKVCVCVCVRVLCVRACACVP